MQRDSNTSRGVWHRMSCKPTIQTVGKAEIRCQSVCILAALSAWLLFQVYFIRFVNVFASDITPFSIALETGSSPSLDVSNLVVLRSHDTGTSHNPLALVGDVLVCVQAEDVDPLDEDPEHPDAVAEASFIPFGQFSSHDSARARFLPSLAIHGLMSRRF
jgi:hypothetical protein